MGTAKKETDSLKPIEIDRYQFKQDRQGFLRDVSNHLFLFDLKTKKLESFANENRNYQSPTWSPSGEFIAYVSKKEDSDRHNNSDLFLKGMTTWKMRFNLHLIWDQIQLDGHQTRCNGALIQKKLHM